MFIIDSGATISVLSYWDYKALGSPPLTPLPQVTNIIAANLTKLIVVGTVDLDLNIGVTARTQRFHVTKGSKNTLLGYDGIVAFDLVIPSARYTTQSHVKINSPSNNTDNTIRVQNNVIIKADKVCGLHVKTR